MGNANEQKLLDRRKDRARLSLFHLYLPKILIHAYILGVHTYSFNQDIFLFTK